MYIAHFEVKQRKKIDRAEINMQTGMPIKYPKETVRL